MHEDRDPHPHAGGLARALVEAPLPTLRVRVPSFALVSARGGLAKVLTEHEARRPAALALWRLATDALTFATADERVGLFATAVDAGVVGGWRGALELASGLYQADETVVARACASLCEEAVERQMRLTAAIFAEARALLRPWDPETALDLAKLARERADHMAAEWWGVRAAQAATRESQWECAARGYMYAAAAVEERGAYRLALRYRWKQFKLAQRARRRVLAARAMHSIYAVHLLMRNRDEAERYAARAVRLYPEGHPRLIALAHDVAWTRLEDGEAKEALRIFRSMWSCSFPPREMLCLTANTARAAALVGDSEMYSTAVHRAEQVLEDSQYGDGAAWALATLGRAAMSAGDTERALRWVTAAYALAVSRGEREVVKLVEYVRELGPT